MFASPLLPFSAMAPSAEEQKHGMVTVRELYSTDLPDFPGPAPNLSISEVEETLALLGDGLPGMSNAMQNGGISNSVPTPFLGPTPDLIPLPLETLEAQQELVRNRRVRACQHLKLALQRRANSRMSSNPSPSFRSESVPSREDLPAVFPWAEPIPHGPPPRRPASQQKRTGSPARGSFCSWTPSQSRMGTSSAPSPDAVPAVFPFPEPIPQGPPSRKPPLHASRVLSSVAPSPSMAQDSSQKYACCSQEFFIDNKTRANTWISECAPKAWFLEHERPVWVQIKHEKAKARRARNRMYRDMPTMPFDLWFEMKQAVETAVTEEKEDEIMCNNLQTELRQHFQELSAQRRSKRFKFSASSKCSEISTGRVFFRRQTAKSVSGSQILPKEVRQSISQSVHR